MGCDIFGLRIVIINGCCWNWNVLMVMELFVKKYMWMSYDIFGLRIVMINGCCWNWNVLMVMESLVKIYVNELWYIWIENCDDKWMLLKLECIDGYGIVDKNEGGMCWKKDVWEYTCDDMYIVWMLWYYENPVVDRW
jgi:hypothetical protein